MGQAQAARSPVQRVREQRHAFMQRTASIFRHQQERAAKADQRLDYALPDLRALVEGAASCHYCGQPLTAHSFSADHATPISRGGTFLRGNLVICCQTCNQAKHDLDATEYTQLRELIALWPEAVRKRFLARLRFAGSAFRPGSSKHQ